MAKAGLSDSYIHSHARAFRTFLRFLFDEGYISKPIKVDMPSIAKKPLRVLSPIELKKVLSACMTKRDKALVMLLVDSGLRRAEACSLNWGDIDIKSGLVRVQQGKGRKSRSVVVGVSTRRNLLRYRRQVSHNDEEPVLQTSTGKRLSHNGLRSALLRIGERAGVHLTPHALRRTFATLSLRAGMNPLHLQGLLGHSSLEMVRRYIRMVDDDLLEAHRKHGPVDRWL
jgi:integrase